MGNNGYTKDIKELVENLNSEYHTTNKEWIDGITRLVEGIFEGALTLRDRSTYHEDYGPVLWWTLPVDEPPYVGGEGDSGFPDYATHWSRIPVPFGIEDAG